MAVIVQQVNGKKINSDNSCELVPSWDKATQIDLLLKCLPSTYHQDFITFFTLSTLNRAAPVFSAMLLLCQYHMYM